ncbi:hypothetical protein L3X38_006177 [Prunus dulcis]|uniref:Retroviral polymerase SH3-like domain-containing protein n=1 Tax=Prunus dulcis TaxID=3755 RepID=A0AAD5F4U9_PRUDU|nr:hypothetical protein L3X38_006177 [Prunus dulcis]
MPRSFWGEVILSAAYLINQIPSSILNFQTPLQTLYHHLQIPHTKNLKPRIFGCVVFVHLHDRQHSKLDPQAKKCVFIGYAPHQKRYRCYYPPSQKVHTSMDVMFWESDIYFSAVQEEDQNAKTSHISEFFPSNFSHIENNRLQDLNNRSPETLPKNDRSPETLPEKTSCRFKTTGRQRTVAGRLLAIKLRRRKLRSFCPLRSILQLQNHNNHMLRTSFR